jgi:hypothetical protein
MKKNLSRLVLSCVSLPSYVCPSSDAKLHSRDALSSAGGRSPWLIGASSRPQTPALPTQRAYQTALC